MKNKLKASNHKPPSGSQRIVILRRNEDSLGLEYRKDSLKDSLTPVSWQSARIALTPKWHNVTKPKVEKGLE